MMTLAHNLRAFWREATGQPFRRCSACGSAHPVDLHSLVLAGAVRFRWRDRSEGWPRWLEFERVGAGTDGPRVAGRFNAEHFLDAPGTRVFAALRVAIHAETQVDFAFRADGMLVWQLAADLDQPKAPAPPPGLRM